MKKTLLYLSVFLILMNLFTYMYFSKKEKHQNQKTHQKNQKITEKQAIIDSLERKIFDMSHYSLDGNYSAQDYVERFFKNHNIEKVNDSILNLNHVKGGNKLVNHNFPDDPMFISRLTILNHRWILADFDNSKLGGQIIVRYFLNEDGTFSLETLDTAMYLPKPNYNED